MMFRVGLWSLAGLATIAEIVAVCLLLTAGQLGIAIALIWYAPRIGTWAMKVLHKSREP